MSASDSEDPFELGSSDFESTDAEDDTIERLLNEPGFAKTYAEGVRGGVVDNPHASWLVHSIGLCTKAGQEAAVAELRSLLPLVDFLLVLWFAVAAADIQSVEVLLATKKRVSIADVERLLIVSVCTARSLPVLRALVDNGFDPVAIGTLGPRLVQLATLARQPDIVEFLLDRGCPPRFPPGTLGQGVIASAGQSGHTRIIDLLVKHGADVNEGPETALHCAAAANDLAMVRHLLGLGATVDPVSQENETPLEVALQLGATSVARELLEAGANTRSLALRRGLRYSLVVAHNKGGSGRLSDCMAVLSAAGVDLRFLPILANTRIGLDNHWVAEGVAALARMGVSPDVPDSVLVGLPPATVRALYQAGCPTRIPMNDTMRVWCYGVSEDQLARAAAIEVLDSRIDDLNVIWHIADFICIPHGKRRGLYEDEVEERRQKRAAALANRVASRAARR